jgi:hypothetical protein
MSSQMYDLCHRRRTYHEVCSAVLGYVNASAVTITKVVQIVALHSNLYDWKYCGHTSKDVVDLVWGNIGKGVNESSKVIYC